MERENKKKGRGRERAEDQLVKKNIGNKKRKLLVQDVKQLNKNTNGNCNIITQRNEDLDVNIHHYDNNINIHNVDEYDDDNDKISRSGGGVFDFPWLHEQQHGNGSGGSMFSDNADYNYFDQYYHHPFFLGFEEYYYGSTFPHAPALNCDGTCYSSTTTPTTTTNARASTGQSSSSSISSLLNNRNDNEYFDSDNSNVNNNELELELELEKMEYYIWSSVLDQPLDIGFFNKYL